MSNHLDDMYDEAVAAARADCAECDAARSYVCGYHLAWADGFEAGQNAMVDYAMEGRP